MSGDCLGILLLFSRDVGGFSVPFVGRDLVHLQLPNLPSKFKNFGLTTATPPVLAFWFSMTSWVLGFLLINILKNNGYYNCKEIWTHTKAKAQILNAKNLYWPESSPYLWWHQKGKNILHFTRLWLRFFPRFIIHIRKHDRLKNIHAWGWRNSCDLDGRKIFDSRMNYTFILLFQIQIQPW